MAIWTPSLAGRAGPKFKQIADAIGDAIASGALRVGERLPPQRELAYVLGLSPNTTSRAYADAIARGFVQGEVGRGTYVRAPGPMAPHASAADMVRPADGPIDFSRNLPAPGGAADILASTLEHIERMPGLPSFLDYQTSSDLDHHADAAVAWLAKTGVAAQRDDVVITCGAQNAILVALLATLRPGDLLLTEDLTYAPVTSMAAHLGLKLVPVRTDDGGLDPQVLAQTCDSRTAAALYCTPTLHTPTTATMDAERRADIVDIARRHDLVIIEDDVFGLLVPERPAPLASMAPERTIYVTSTSKCLAPGLRIGYARAPARYAAALRAAVNLTCWMPPPLMAEIAARWIFDGTADMLTERQRTEAHARQRLARTILQGHTMRAQETGLHLWLELPSHWPPDVFRAAAAKRGVAVTEGATFAVEPSHRPGAIRLSLSHEPSLARVKTGLEIVRGLLDERATDQAMIL